LFEELNEDGDVVFKSGNDLAVDSTVFVKDGALVDASELVENNLVYVFSDINENVALVADTNADTTVETKGATTLEVGNGTYFVTSNTLFFDVTNTNNSGALVPALISYADLKTTDEVLYTVSGNNFELVFVTVGGTAVADDALPTVYGQFCR
jgi:uncharacterized membrane protein